MSDVREINSLKDLESIRLLWDSLWPRTPDAMFFQSYRWLEAYWRHCGENQRLKVLVVKSPHGPLGILPLVVRTEATRIGRVRVLTFPLDDWGSFYGPIGPNPTATLMAGLSYIRRARRDWDMIDMRWVDEAGHDRGRTPQAMRACGFQAHRQAWSQTAQIQLTGDWDSYWVGRKSHWRTNCRRNERRLAEAGEVTYVRYRPAGARQGDDDPRWDLLDACQQIARDSWQGSSATGTTMSHDSVKAFLRDTHAAAAAAGCLDLNLLKVNGRPVAFNYNYNFHGRLFGLRMGFVDRPETSGAGTVLVQKMIRDSFQRDDQLIDMGSKYLDCKRHWTTRIKTSYRYSHFPTTAVRVQALRAKRWMRQLLAGEETPLMADKNGRSSA